MTPEQEQAIAELRARHVAPKLIARQLGLRPAEVTAVIKAQAQQVTAERAASGELAPLYQCLVNKNCLPALLPNQYPAEIAASKEEANHEGAGLAVVTVTRQTGFNRLEVSTCLVDLWCLGVKDAAAPRRVDPTTYREFVEYAYEPFPDGPEEIPLELAQAIIFGAIDYAARLGFQPHADFEQVRPQLGQWSGEPVLTFGRDGKPCYFNGPYDNPIQILKTLRESVGEGNFDFILVDGE
jgi:hypothetical protein